VDGLRLKRRLDMALVQGFVMNQNLLSLSGDMWIEDSQGNHAFEVDGKAFSLHGLHVLKDLQGNDLYDIQQALGHLHTTFQIKRAGQVVATIQKALLTLLGDRFTITLASGAGLRITGDWLDRDFRISDGTRDVIVASRRLISLHGAYGVEIADGFDVPLGLAIVIALEQMERQVGRD
jgi:uncharacterized protein YxjI